MDTSTPAAKTSFTADVHFVSRYHRAVVLSGNDSTARILVCPALQGRVLTSTLDGPDGQSLGYFNHQRIGSQKMYPHSQGYGGEDRFWIGPQGGQYTVFFKAGAPFDFDHWQTPEAIDREPFEVVNQQDSAITLKKEMTLTNYSGFTFQLSVKRTIRTINPQQAQTDLGIAEWGPAIRYVGFESNNTLTNVSDRPWARETGLLSIWILGQFPAGATVVMPCRDGSGQIPYTTYFRGQTPELTGAEIKTGAHAIYYNGNGKAIGKIGLKPGKATGYFGSYHPDSRVLTIIQYSYRPGDTDYVNSLWKQQQHPYDGDVINAYNDGALDANAPHTPTFYELESSSATQPLKPGEQLSHVHRTFHFQGDEAALDRICESLLGTTIAHIQSQFPNRIKPAK